MATIKVFGEPLRNMEVGFSIPISSTTKTMTMIGSERELAAFNRRIDIMSRPCEVKKNLTDFAYLRNTAGVASSTNWLKRADGSDSHYNSEDKNDYLQLTEIDNVNIKWSYDATADKMTVLFNFDTCTPPSYQRMFIENSKLMGRYDITYANSTTCNCARGCKQTDNNPNTDALSANVILSLIKTTNASLLSWTAWEISCLSWIMAMYYRTLDVPSQLGSGIQDGGQATAAAYVNGTSDSLTTPHGKVSNGGAIRFMYIENPYALRWLWGAGWRGENGTGYYVTDDVTANAAATMSTTATGVKTHTYLTSLSSTYPKNVNNFGIGTETGGGFPDGQWSNTSTSRVFYAGGTSPTGAICGAFARTATIDASYSSWDRRGRCALRKSVIERASA